MAKKAMINKELRREKLVAAGKYPAVRLHNRCSICGRPHGFHRDFGLCRICLRKMAHEGLLPGVTKASWQVAYPKTCKTDFDINIRGQGRIATFYASEIKYKLSQTNI